MLVGAVMGFWTVQRIDADAGSRSPQRSRRDAGRCSDGVDPRLPRDLPAREPDRLRARPDDLRRRGRALELPRQQPQPRRSAGRPPVRPGLSALDAALAGRGPISSRRTCSSTGRGSSSRHRLLPQPHTPGLEAAPSGNPRRPPTQWASA